MLNARSLKMWLKNYYKEHHPDIDEATIFSKHLCACSTNLTATKDFGILEENVFGFWDFVGGRFSVWSSIGILPLSISFGFDQMTQFLAGGHSIDRHLQE